MGRDILDMERKVARCRVLLSLVAIVAAFVDPQEAAPLAPRLATLGMMPDPRATAVLVVHLGFSLAIWALLMVPRVASPRMVAFTTGNDVLFAAVIGIFTHGASSPFYVFFTFAVVAAAVRSGFRFSVMVTAVTIWLYLALTIVTASRGQPVTAFVILRPFYLAILGYLVAYLGRQRLGLESKLVNLERARERGEIARSLHDGCVQALAGTNLSLESCRELVRRGRSDEALATLAELQASLTREYDGLRSYVRELAERDTPPSVPRDFETRFAVRAEFDGSGTLVEHILQIMLEGVRNVRHHAFARLATIEARRVNGEVRVAIDDDGVGLDGAQPPWSIASHVAQLGGQIRVSAPGSTGAHVDIVLRGA